MRKKPSRHNKHRASVPSLDVVGWDVECGTVGRRIKAGINKIRTNPEESIELPSHKRNCAPLNMQYGTCFCFVDIVLHLFQWYNYWLRVSQPPSHHFFPWSQSSVSHQKRTSLQLTTTKLDKTKYSKKRQKCYHTEAGEGKLTVGKSPKRRQKSQR